jgi:hypothetical protein
MPKKKRRNTGGYKPSEGFNECLPIIVKDSTLCRAGCGRSDHKTSASKKYKFNLANKVLVARNKKSKQDVEIERLRARVRELEENGKNNK